jgi:predicted amidohydrolase YtcJ
MHCYLWPTAESMAEAARLGVFLSAQPAMQWRVGGGIARKFGADAASTAPLRNWLDAGVEVAGGSDGPDFPMAPLFGMWQARSRMVRGIEQPLGAGQAIEAMEALGMYTTSGARYSFSENDRGMLAAGYLADWVELAVDPITASMAELEAILDEPVRRTVIGGRVVHGAPLGAGPL